VAASPSADLLIRDGTCYVLFAYDLGHTIDLDAAARLIEQATERESIKHRRRTPQYFEYRPLPLRVAYDTPAMPVGRATTHPGVECLLFDFGAVSLTYAVPLGGSLASLAPLCDELYDCEELREDSRRRVEHLLAAIAAAVTRPNLSGFVEDYTIYEIRRWEGAATGAEILERFGPAIAQVLRAEMSPLSDQERVDALAFNVSYGRDDAAIIDWNAAMLFAREAEDVRAVLEFANIELLEMRHLDDTLDGVLDDFYRTLSHRGWRRRSLLRSPARELRRLAHLQMDAAILFEAVNNALKLLGDQFLARVYRAASQRLHVAEWDSSILRKLRTLESIHSRFADYQSARRMEVLEWVIIILIAFEIVWSLSEAWRS
jgi:hypothetical protein